MLESAIRNPPNIQEFGISGLIRFFSGGFLEGIRIRSEKFSDCQPNKFEKYSLFSPVLTTFKRPLDKFEVNYQIKFLLKQFYDMSLFYKLTARLQQLARKKDFVHEKRRNNDTE